MKILNVFILLIYAIVLGLFLSASAHGTTGSVTYAVQVMASQKQLPTTDAVFKGVTDIHEETFTTGPVKYKYTTGWTNSWKEIKETYQKLVDAGFTGAFIVTYTDGSRTVKNTTDNTAMKNVNTTTGTTIFTNADGTTTKMTTKKVTNTNGTTSPAQYETATTKVIPANPNTTTGTTIFTNSDGTTTAMTTKKVTKTDGSASGIQYEMITTTAPAAANTWNTNTNSSTAETTTTANGNTVTVTTKKVTKTTTWVNADGTTTTTPAATSTNTETQNGATSNTTETNTNWNNNTTTKNATATTNHVYRGYGETLTQTEPVFPDGDNGLYTFVRNHLSYVLQTQSTGEWKHGFLTFTIDRTGKAKNAWMMTGITKEVDAAALSMVSQMPNWTPAMVSGNPVEKQYIMPLDCFIPAPVPSTSTK
jgi:hypothetical protein